MRVWRRWLPVLLLCAAGTAWADEKVDVEGLSGQAYDNMEAYLGKLSEDDFKNWRTTLSRLRNSARDAMESVGYFQADFDFQRKGNRVTLVVRPGEPVRVRNISLKFDGEAGNDIAFTAARESLPLKTGDIFNQGQYEAFKTHIQNLGLERGYFDGEWSTHKATVDVQNHTADLDLVYNSGARFTFGTVTFQSVNKDGTLAVKPKVLDSLVPFQQGEPYEAAKVIKLNKLLLDSRYFGDVRVRAEPEKAVDRVVPVLVYASTLNPNTIDTGLGYSTDVGPRITLGWRRPLLNESGHGIEFSTELSQVRRTFDAKYTIPLTHPINDTLQFLFGVKREEIDQTIPTSSTLLGVQRQINRDTGWQQVQSLRLTHEDFVIDNVSGSSDLLLPGLALTRTRIKGGGIDPYWGDRQFYQVQVGSREFVSDTNIVNARASFRFLRTYADRHMFIFRADGGAILTDNFDRVPPTMRFYAGGDQSVRGYDYQSIGPRDENGIVVGGRYLATGSAEYDYLFKPRWRAAVFLDAGNAFNVASEPLKLGTGFGVRWISPVGAIKLDFAFGISEPNVPFRLHISMGAPL